MKTVRATVVKANVSETIKQIYEDGFNYEVDGIIEPPCNIKRPSILPFFSNASKRIVHVTSLYHVFLEWDEIFNHIIDTILQKSEGSQEDLIHLLKDVRDELEEIHK
ncbi:hypothetical protein [Bacillus safensis]|uniref:Uncharacterized protein n=1 Tax=Bacillus safensis TaxID=561879 RepID=A0AC61ZXY3_BACIA